MEAAICIIKTPLILRMSSQSAVLEFLLFLFEIYLRRETEHVAMQLDKLI